MEAGQYPLDVYAGWFRALMMFVVPIGCVGYLPLIAHPARANIVGAPAWLFAASPAMGFIFLGLSLWVWKAGRQALRLDRKLIQSNGSAHLLLPIIYLRRNSHPNLSIRPPHTKRQPRPPSP